MAESSTLNATVTPIDGGITAAKGFTSAALHSGIKVKTGALDLTVIASEKPVATAGLFTLNLVQAAPVILSKEHLERSSGLSRAIVVNSGCANACTGTQGFADAKTMVGEVATSLGCPVEQVLVASTGVIGVNLNMSKVAPGIRAAVSQLARG